MMKVTLRKGHQQGVTTIPACMTIHIDQPRMDDALYFIEDVLTKRGPIHKPELKGIHHDVVDARHQGRILVDFPDWETEWEGSWNDLRICACQIADHLNLEAETEK